MFTKAQTRAPRYILFKSFFLAIGWSYRHDLSHTFSKRLKRPNIKIVYFFVFLSIKTSSQNISIMLLQISPFTNIEAAIGGKSSRKRFWKNSSQCQKILHSKQNSRMASFCWYDNPDVIPTVIKFSSMSNTTVVAIIPNLCLWRRSLCSNLGGIDAP